MNKPILYILLTLLVVSCTDINQMENKIAEMKKLRTENDSLKKIMAEINNKYIFDSITIRDIPSYKNSYEPNTTFSGEIVFIGYNNDTLNTKVIMIDSVTYNPKKLYNPDTLKLKNGGYHYQKKMDADQVYWKAEIQTKHQYGKKFEGVLINAVQSKKN